jgi:hypothetical protein
MVRLPSLMAFASPSGPRSVSWVLMAFEVAPVRSASMSATWFSGPSVSMVISVPGGSDDSWVRPFSTPPCLAASFASSLACSAVVTAARTTSRFAFARTSAFRAVFRWLVAVVISVVAATAAAALLAMVSWLSIRVMAAFASLMAR